MKRSRPSLFVLSETEHVAETLDKWAEVVTIPSGDFINDDLRRAALYLRRLKEAVVDLGTEIELLNQHRFLEFELDDCLEEDRDDLKNQIKALRKKLDKLEAKRVKLFKKGM